MWLLVQAIEKPLRKVLKIHGGYLIVNVQCVSENGRSGNCNS